MTPYTAPGIIIQIDPMQIPELCGVDVHVTNRLQENFIPRQIAMALMYVFSSYSLRQVGNPFTKDHSTVLHAIKCVNDGLASNDHLVLPLLTTVFNRLYFAHNHVRQMIDLTQTKVVASSNEVDKRLRKYEFSRTLIKRWEETNWTKIPVNDTALASV
ncbi:MAG: hypothetical protein KBD57_05960 [Bacteroidia bacterium]|nr:hypothetical protein [Bacteroidia bacterium]